MEEQLREKLKEALTTLTENSIEGGIESLEEPGPIRDSINRQAEEQAKKLHEYLQEFVFQRLEDLEGKVENLESRLEELGSPGPSGTA